MSVNSSSLMWLIGFFGMALAGTLAFVWQRRRAM